MKFLIKYILPEILLDLLRIIRRFKLYANDRKTISSNARMKNSAIGKSCIFLGNGPSLEIDRISKINQYDVFVCNGFFQVKGSQSVDVKYYLNFDVSNEWLTEVENYLNQKKPEYFVFSLHNKQKIEKSKFHEYFPRQNTIYLHGILETKLDRYFCQIDRPVFNIKNVIIGFMLLSGYNRYENAFLYGVDFSFLTVPRKAEIRHAYDNELGHPNVTAISSYGKMCNSTSVVLRYIEMLNRLTKTNFYNCTPNSYIDVLEFFVETID